MADTTKDILEECQVNGFAPFVEIKADSMVFDKEDKWEFKDYDTDVELSFKLPYVEAKTLLEKMRKSDPNFCKMTIVFINKTHDNPLIKE